MFGFHHSFFSCGKEDVNFCPNVLRLAPVLSAGRKIVSRYIILHLRARAESVFEIGMREYGVRRAVSSIDS